MSYLVLARKYRPQVFEDVVGQGHVTRTLANAITSDRVAHAYLFCGPRGVGKTTAARILAKALNCEKGPTPTPCNTCNACVEITRGHSMDVLEIDGASNRGINEVRELRENTRYASSGRSKVYIIDEVHMLTNEAFNALLKTLEEPPPHVVFVLATTEPFKMPATILSRCQRFDFARIPAREITAHLQQLVEAESLAAEPEALALVARRAQGGLRDALSLMDQVISAVEGTIDRPAVERTLGIVGGDVYASLVEHFAAQDAGAALRLIDETYRAGVDLGDFAEGLASHLRDLLLLRIDGDLGGLIEVPPSELAMLGAQAERFTRETLAEMADRAAELPGELRRNEHPRLTLELAVAEMADAAARMPLGEVVRRLMQLEAQLGGAPGAAATPPGGGSSRPTPGTKPDAKRPTRGAPAPSRTPRSSPPDRPSPRAQAKPDKDADATAGRDTAQVQPLDLNEPVSLWSNCLASLNEAGRMRLWGSLQPVTAVGFATDGALILSAGTNPLVRDALREPDTRHALGEILATLGRRPARVILDQDVVPDIASGGKPEPEPGTPRKKKVEAPGMGEFFREQPILQKALDIFDGEVLP